MKASIVTILLALLLALPAAAGSASQDTDMAVSFNLGLADPVDNDFDGTDLVYTGTFEFYTSPRLSWRGLLGTTSFDADGPGNATLDVTFLDANVVYNWEQGKIHPYVTGGIGFYDGSGSGSLPSKFEDSSIGLNGGGGVNWFLDSRNWALKFEGTLHGLSGDGPDTFFLGTAGVIFWF